MKINWIGIDAHKQFCTISVLNNKGVLISQRDIPTNESDLIQSIISIKGDRNIAIEESSIANWLFLTLQPYASNLIISDPLKNNWIHSSEDKSDKVDSVKLADLFRMNRISAVYHTEIKALTIMKKLINHYDKLVQNSTRAMNRIKGEYTSVGIFTQGKKVYSIKERQSYLKKIRSVHHKAIINNYYSQYDMYRDQQLEILKRLKTISKRHPILNKLRTIPSIGFIRSITIYTTIITPYRFTSRSQINKYCGLAIVEKTSANKVLCSYASKTGNRVLKNVLMEAAKTSIYISKDDYFSQRHAELMKKGLSQKSAIRSIAREIIHISLGVWRNNKKFSDKIAIENKRTEKKVA